MPRYNAEWEDQIKGYRSKRRLLVAKSLHFGATTTAVEAAIRARLTKPDSVIFLWPPGAANPNQHKGWVMVAFSSRSDAQWALGELEKLEIRGRAVNVERASRQAYSPTSPDQRGAVDTTTTTTATTASTTATTAATAATVSTTDLPVRLAPALDTAACSPSKSLEEGWELESAGDADSLSDIAFPENFNWEDLDAEGEVESEDD